jgi:hypothetical protein
MSFTNNVFGQEKGGSEGLPTGFKVRVHVTEPPESPYTYNGTVTLSAPGAVFNPTIQYFSIFNDTWVFEFESILEYEGTITATVSYYIYPNYVGHRVGTTTMTGFFGNYSTYHMYVTHYEKGDEQ